MADDTKVKEPKKTIQSPPAPWMKVGGVAVGIGGDSIDANGKKIPEANATQIKKLKAMGVDYPEKE